MRLKIFSVKKEILKLLNAIHVNRSGLSKYFVNLSDILRDSNYIFKVARVVNIKLGLMDRFYYNSIILMFKKQGNLSGTWKLWRSNSHRV